MRSPHGDDPRAKFARHASPMQVDVKSVSPAKGVKERTSRPYSTQKSASRGSPMQVSISKSPSTYHSAKSHSRTYFSIPVSKPASRPAPPRPPPAPRVSPPKVPLPQMLRMYYHSQLLKIKEQYDFSPFKLTLRMLAPLHPDKVLANTSLEIKQNHTFNSAINEFYRDLGAHRDKITTFDIIWGIYRKHWTRLL